jgi:hypothetical protein
MKNEVLMPKNIAAGLLLLVASGASAAPGYTSPGNVGNGEVVGAPAENPFSQGIRRTPLSPDQKKSLMQWGDSSKERLVTALAKAQGLPFDEANGIYWEVMKNVVIESYKEKPRTELLMRYALNQALELTYGVPTADGIGVEKPGMLAGMANKDLLTLILEDSIKLAIQYYISDRDAIKDGNLINLPYMHYAFRKLELSRKWLAAITEWQYQFTMEMVSLGQWLETANLEDNLNNRRYAQEILTVDGTLRKFSVPGAPATLPGKVRELRGLVRKVLESENNRRGPEDSSRSK